MNLPQGIPTEWLKRFKRGPTDVVGLDLGALGIPAVRIQRNGHDVTVVAADVLPALPAPEAEAGEEEESAAPSQVLTVPAEFKAKYACLALQGNEAVVRLLGFPGRFTPDVEAQVIDSMGLEDPDNYRVSYQLLSEGHGRSESHVLAVALPDEEATWGVGLLPTGTPAPLSLEVSGLATATAFFHAVKPEEQDDAVGLLSFGDGASLFTLFKGDTLLLARRFRVGTVSVINRVRTALGVDRETAEGIISDGSFDISQAIGEVLEALVKQMIVSRDYVERREDCRVSAVYVSGVLATSHDTINELRTAVGSNLQQWNPFEGLTIAEGALNEKYTGQEWRFAAAIGAALASLEAS